MNSQFAPLIPICWLALSTNLLAAPPKLDLLFPSGAARGTITEVTASGTFDVWPAKVWTDRLGVKFEAKEEKGKLAVTVSDSAEPGVAWVRLYTDDGASAVRPFVIGTLPEAVESEPNNEPAKPQVLE